MGLFSKPEVIILKEDSDAPNLLRQYEELREGVEQNSELYKDLTAQIRNTKAGIAGEENVLYELKKSQQDLIVLRDLYIEEPSGAGAQIDYLVVTPYVNVIIECKSLYGTVTIDGRGSFIRKNWGHEEGIYNPVTQNEEHLRVLKECRKANRNALIAFGIEHNFNEYNKSLIVLANDNTVLHDRYAPKEIRKQVIRRDRLITALSEMRSDSKSSKKEMLARGERFLSMNKPNPRDYISEFRERREEYDKSTLSDEKICPRCGNLLVLRTARKGEHAGEQFYGCSGFPKCRYTMHASQTS